MGGNGAAIINEQALQRCRATTDDAIARYIARLCIDLALLAVPECGDTDMARLRLATRLRACISAPSQTLIVSALLRSCVAW